MLILGKYVVALVLCNPFWKHLHTLRTRSHKSDDAALPFQDDFDNDGLSKLFHRQLAPDQLDRCAKATYFAVSGRATLPVPAAAPPDIQAVTCASFILAHASQHDAARCDAWPATLSWGIGVPDAFGKDALAAHHRPESDDSWKGSSEERGQEENEDWVHDVSEAEDQGEKLLTFLNLHPQTLQRFRQQWRIGALAHWHIGTVAHFGWLMKPPKSLKRACSRGEPANVPHPQTLHPQSPM